MIEDRIRNIEARINGTEHLPSETRRELLELLAALKSEVAALPPHCEEDAQRITLFAEASAHEAIQEEKKPELLKAAIEGLEESVEEFEVSHPKLAETINRMALILSNMGI